METWLEYSQDRLKLCWREWLTTHLVDEYLAGRRFYIIELRRTIDNPDQRLHEDADHLTGYSVKIAMDVLHSSFQLIVFFWVLWSLSPWLAVSQLLLAASGTAATVVLGNRLVGMNKEQQRKEADFRYGLVHLRDHSEAVAFYQGEDRERSFIGARFNALCRNREAIIWWQCVLGFFTHAYAYLPIVLPYFLAAPLYFSGQLDIGGLQQAGMGFQRLHTALALIVKNFTELSAFDASIKRLRDFQVFFAQPPYCLPVVARKEGPEIAASQLSVVLPNWERVLLEGLDLVVGPKGPSTLIVGSSGVGKTAVLRTVAGLWQSGRGVLSCPASFDELLFVPQKPYMALGTLRQQLLYPKPEASVPDDQLLAVLQVVNLGSLPTRFAGFDRVVEWATVLSLGEQQRLSLARVLLVAPTYVILDEATSALDEANETLVYEQLRKRGIMYLSVGHRMSLLRYHDQVLRIVEGGTWTLIPAPEFADLLVPRSSEVPL
eukprot:TRINITY_DN1719_c0_g1_i1.p1 TRINITY_DN1719_c0_g1~~TRINITY_DN1719_c0_g1_i1.p1  ORF type:complete len:490 (+),score=157.23 TRINITY_DN1719_c0_g1_i1:489-1958(+)